MGSIIHYFHHRQPGLTTFLKMVPIGWLLWQYFSLAGYRHSCPVCHCPTQLEVCVFIGDIKTDVSSLKALPNVYFLGSRPHDQLPSYVQHWTCGHACLFAVTSKIDACNPLKLREYLASGTPIASTSFPAVREYENLIAIQSSKEPFSRVILRANELSEEKTSRQNRVSTESWQHRATQLEALINHLSR